MREAASTASKARSPRRYTESNGLELFLKHNDRGVGTVDHCFDTTTSHHPLLLNTNLCRPWLGGVRAAPEIV